MTYGLGPGLYPLGTVLASCQISTLCVRKNCVSDLSSCASSELGSELTSLVGSELGSELTSLAGTLPVWGKENGIYTLQSIDHGLFELETTRDTLGTTPKGGVLLGPERPRTYDDLNDNEKKRFDADIRATNIVLQGLPEDIYKLINHNTEAKAIWDNVKMLLNGSELTKEDRESQLYDELERFKMLLGENINEYYVRFHKLVNDMRNIMMTMPNIQLNFKFVNNMSLEWDRFVTAVKLKKGLKETNHKQLYAYLKQHEKHATQDRLIIERITPTTNDQLAFVLSVQPYTNHHSSISSISTIISTSSITTCPITFISTKIETRFCI
nr:retrovirus-related Pol polyprotein from transposon TNT 1-94 [Tanacetum cinerariifolium]